MSPLPECRIFQRDPSRDELLILACDGIWDVMSNEEAVKFVRQQRSSAPDAPTATICAALIDACLARGERAKAGSDNMTAVLVEVR